MAVDIGPKIGLDGESEFRKQLQNVNQSLKTLGSEMKLVTAEFAANADSEEALTKKNDVLERSVSTLRDKLEMQQKALQESAQKFGEADARTMKWQQAVNETEAALATAENQIKQNTKALDDNEEANESAAEAEEKHTISLGKVAAAFGAMATAAAGAAVALAKNVISSFGELEQNLGGSEAVFGKYAETIQKEGEDAYKNLGVSQSEYLATANKIGALFQGTGVEQERSLELTTQAMQRAADMASVMGINTEDALNAITGAAKGNYTMMDNLGVAMNNTALEAYAIEKGFDKAFGSMSQAEKAEVAMQYFFENTQQYAGNFAREATQTVSGAIGLFTAAKDSLIAGLGSADADIANLAQNLIDAGLSVFQNVGPVIQNLTAALPDVISALLDGIQSVLPQLLPAGLSLVKAIIDGIVQSLPILIPVATQIITELTTYLMSPDTLGELIQAALTILTTLATQLTTALPELVPVAVEAILTLVDTLISNADQLVDASIQIIFALTDGLIAALPTLLDQAPVIVEKLVAALVENAPKLLESGLQLIVKLVAGLIENLPQIGKAAVDIVTTLLEGIADLFVSFVDMGRNIVEGIVEGIQGAFDWAWQQVKDFFKNIIDGVKDFLGIHSPSTVFAEIGRYMAEGLGEGWEEGAKPVFQKVVDDIKAGYTKAFDSARGTINSQIKLFDDFAAAISEDTNTAEKMLERWATQTENLSKYTENLKRAAEYGLDKGLIESLSDGSAQSAGYLSTIIQKIDSLGAESAEAAAFINDFNAGFSATASAKDDFAQTVASMRDEIGYELSQMPEEWLTAGEDMVNSMIEGLDMESSNLYNKVTEIVKNALYKARESIGTLLPSSSANAGVISAMQGTGVTNAMAESVNALGAISGASQGDLTIQMVIDGREFSRAILPDFRLVQAQNPIIVNDF